MKVRAGVTQSSGMGSIGGTKATTEPVETGAPKQPGDAFRNGAPQVVRLDSGPGTPLSTNASADQLGWQQVTPDATNAALSSEQQARVAQLAGQALAQVEAFASKNPGGAISVEAVIGKGGELGGMMDAAKAIRAKWPGADVGVITESDFPVAGDVVSLKVQLPD